MGKGLRFIGVVEEAREQEAKVRIFPEFCPGLKGVEGFSHLIILYWFHQREGEEERRTLQVVPRRHGAPQVGVFTSRSSSRPNPIGLCVVELTKIENCILFVKGLDAFEGSPIIDIKPYFPRRDSISSARVPEWMLHGPHQPSRFYKNVFAVTENLKEASTVRDDILAMRFGGKG